MFSISRYSFVHRCALNTLIDIYGKFILPSKACLCTHPGRGVLTSLTDQQSQQPTQSCYDLLLRLNYIVAIPVVVSIGFVRS